MFVIYIFIKYKDILFAAKNLDDVSPIETLCLNGCQVGNPNEEIIAIKYSNQKASKIILMQI